MALFLGVLGGDAQRVGSVRKFDGVVGTGIGIAIDCHLNGNAVGARRRDGNGVGGSSHIEKVFVRSHGEFEGLVARDALASVVDDDFVAVLLKSEMRDEIHLLVVGATFAEDRGTVVCCSNSVGTQCVELDGCHLRTWVVVLQCSVRTASMPLYTLGIGKVSLERQRSTARIEISIFPIPIVARIWIWGNIAGNTRRTPIGAGNFAGVVSGTTIGNGGSGRAGDQAVVEIPGGGASRRIGHDYPHKMRIGGFVQLESVDLGSP